jgi:hypothetical protein
MQTKADVGDCLPRELRIMPGERGARMIEKGEANRK